jgi:predicted  nucleic acid-binding Zn-ribbon protein
MEEELQRLEGRVSELERDTKEANQAIQRLEGRMSKVEGAQEASSKNLFQSAATNAHNPKQWHSGKPSAMIRKAAVMQ